MKITSKNELLLLIILTILLTAITFFLSSNVLRVVIGLPLVLFLPGYSLVSALFPRKTSLDGIERIVLSFVLSIVMVAFIGFILNYTPWGIRLPPVLVSILVLVVTTSLVAWHRRQRLDEVGFTISINLSLAPLRGQGFVDRIISIVLIVIIIVIIGTLGYVIARPKVGESFTEFYILGTQGKADSYPIEVLVGEAAKVTVGIINQEHEDASYQVEVTVDGIRNRQTSPLLLHYEDKWEQEVSFTPPEVGDNQKVEFILYKDDKPYRTLFLWIDVVR